MNEEIDNFHSLSVKKSSHHYIKYHIYILNIYLIILHGNFVLDLFVIGSTAQQVNSKDGFTVGFCILYL